MLHARTWIVVVLLLAPAQAAAQAPQSPSIGQPVRVSHRCRVTQGTVTECHANRFPRVDTGQIQTIEGDTLRILPQGRVTAFAIPVAAIDGLWVVDGKRGNFVAGAGIGLLAGALLGAVIGSTQEFCIFDCSPATGIGFILGAPVGLVIGGAVGASTRSDRWHGVRLEDLRVSVALRREALGFRASIGF